MKPATCLWPLTPAPAAWPVFAQKAPPLPLKMSDPIVMVKGDSLTYVRTYLIKLTPEDC